MIMSRRCHVGALVAVLVVPFPAAAEPIRATLYKSPQCGCCETYAAYLRSNGFDVTVKKTLKLAEISRDAGVPPHMQGCHTMFIDGYVVDGHVPANTIRKLLADRPAVAGIVLPGMPQGSPGMSGIKTGPFVIYAVTKDGAAPAIYAKD